MAVFFVKCNEEHSCKCIELSLKRRRGSTTIHVKQLLKMVFYTNTSTFLNMDYWDIWFLLKYFT